MQERQSEERCDGCPFKIAPQLDNTVKEILMLYQDLSTPIGQNLSEKILEAYKPMMSRLDFIQLIKSLNMIQQIQTEHLNRKIKKETYN